MLYNILFPLAEEFQVLNLFKYITFRSGGAIFTAFLIAMFCGMPIINWLKSWQHGGQPIRTDGPESHLKTKKGTPTMGGFLILMPTIISTLIWSDVKNPFMWIVLFVTVAFGFLGFMDDYLKVKKKNTKGVSGKRKLVFQAVVALVATYLIQIYSPQEMQSQLAFPFFKNFMLDLGVMYYLFTFLVIVGASNAVNLTDGLDGLAIMPIVIAAGCFGLISYLIGNHVFANYLQVHYVAGSGELAVVCASLVGAGLGFLWFNAPPAKVFMGDTGSLALGGAIGTIAVITKHEIVLAIIGGLFVIEAASVILQVYYYRFTGGKRIFLMAPLHHHFEKKGWAESTIVMRFWIVAVIFALLGLSTLKLR